MALNRASYLPPPYSVWCFRLCWHTLLVMATSVSVSDTRLTESSLTYWGCGQNQSSGRSVRDLFADDCALYATTDYDMQKSLDQVCNACEDFGLALSTKKTCNFLHSPTSPSTKKSFTVADKFVYLSSTLSWSAKVDEAILLNRKS